MTYEDLIQLMRLCDIGKARSYLASLAVEDEASFNVICKFLTKCKRNPPKL